MICMNDVVLLNQDMPECNLVKGQHCTVLEVFTKPDLAYEVEFVGDDGQTVAQLTLKPDQIADHEAIKTIRKLDA